MKPVYQDKYEPPDANCLQACLASLFELPLDVVPEFQYLYPRSDWFSFVERWCIQNYRLQPVTINIQPDWKPLGFHLIGGKTANGIEHVVVGYAGEIVHDPVLTGTSLTPHSYLIFVSMLNLGI